MVCVLENSHDLLQIKSWKVELKKFFIYLFSRSTDKSVSLSSVSFNEFATSNLHRDWNIAFFMSDASRALVTASIESYLTCVLYCLNLKTTLKVLPNGPVMSHSWPKVITFSEMVLASLKYDSSYLKLHLTRSPAGFQTTDHFEWGAIVGQICEHISSSRFLELGFILGFWIVSQKEGFSSSNRFFFPSARKCHFS